MYNPNKKHYIVKKSTGEVFNFYYDERLGLAYSKLTKKNLWSESISICKNIHSSFVMQIDNNDVFHFIFQNKQGSVFYLKMQSGNINTIPILQSKFQSNYNKHFYIQPIGSELHCFFIINHKNAKLLAHQILKNNVVLKPKVIDYCHDTEHPFHVVIDKSNDLYVFYQSSDEKNIQIGYKKYITSKNYWNEFTPITKNQNSSEFPKALICEKNIVHLIYQKYTGNNYELVYLSKYPEKNIWKPEILLYTSPNPFFTSSIIYLYKTMIVYWIREHNIFYTSSEDHGATWSEVRKYNYPSNKNLLCMSYITNYNKELSKIYTHTIPGNYLNGFTLAFFNNFFNNNEDISVDEFKNIILEGFSLLKESVNELKEFYTKLNNSFIKINNSNALIKKELDKHSIRLRLLENINNTSVSKYLSSDLISENGKKFNIEKYKKLYDKKYTKKGFYK